MKVVFKKISVICWFNEEGEISPIRIKLLNEEGEICVINIDKVVERKTEKLIGNLTHCYLCEASINNIKKLLELKYEITTSKWILYKIG